LGFDRGKPGSGPDYTPKSIGGGGASKKNNQWAKKRRKVSKVTMPRWKGGYAGFRIQGGRLPCTGIPRQNLGGELLVTEHPLSRGKISSKKKKTNVRRMGEGNFLIKSSRKKKMINPGDRL